MVRLTWMGKVATATAAGALLLSGAMLFVVPRQVYAAKPTETCLTGSAADVANDPAQIQAVRLLVDSSCVCSDFDGSKGKTHGSYVHCATGVINTQVQNMALRPQCKGTVKAYYTRSTCGGNPSLHGEPCIQTNLTTGKITCAIKPTTKKDGVTASTSCTSTAKFSRTSCPGFTQCIDAADTDGNRVIAAPGDSGSCGVLPTPTITPTSTPTETPTSTATASATVTPTPVCANKTDGMTCDAGTDGPQALICLSGACVPCSPDAGAAPRFVDNADGTITDRTTCLVWEKKDINSSGLHSVYGNYRWAGYCTNNTGKNCQPDAAASAACGSAFGCAQCGITEGACTGAFVNQTVFQWLDLVNAASFAGHGDWRLPKEEGRSGAGGANELETILAAPYLCSVGPPCVDAAFNTNCGTDNNNFGCTIDAAGGTQQCSCSGSANYWSATGSGGSAWLVIFSSGYPAAGNQLYNFQARAVRGGM